MLRGYRLRLSRLGNDLLRRFLFSHLIPQDRRRGGGAVRPRGLGKRRLRMMGVCGGGACLEVNWVTCVRDWVEAAQQAQNSSGLVQEGAPRPLKHSPLRVWLRRFARGALFTSRVSRILAGCRSLSVKRIATC